VARSNVQSQQHYQITPHRFPAPPTFSLHPTSQQTRQHIRGHSQQLYNNYGFNEVHYANQNAAAPAAYAQGSASGFHNSSHPSFPQKSLPQDHQNSFIQHGTSTAPPHILNDMSFDFMPFANGTAIPDNSGSAINSHVQQGGHQQASFSRIPSHIESSNQPNQSSLFNFSNIQTPTFAQQSTHAAMVTQQPNPILVFSAQQTQTSSVSDKPGAPKRLGRTSVSMTVLWMS
jgi:hypothetical protein